MTIDTAIELNKQAVESLQKGKHPTHAEAVQLGIEALKWKKRWSACFSPENYKLLPGETKE